MQRDHGFACADIALQQTQHGRVLLQVAFDLADRTFLRPCQRERQLQLAPQAPVTGERAPAFSAVIRAHQLHRELVGEQFVVRETVLRALVVARMDAVQRIGPGGPFLARQHSGLDPLRQRGQLVERLRGEARHARLRQPFGQWIDRLAHLAERGIVHLHYMVRMHHLEHVAIPFQLARDAAGLAHRQFLLRGVAGPPEEGQREEVARAVGSEHAIRRAARGTGAMLGHGQRDDDLLALGCLVQIVDRTAGHEPVGPVIGDIAHPRAVQLLQRLLQLGPDTVERVDFGKQGIEDFGPHGTIDMAQLSRHCERSEAIQGVPLWIAASGHLRCPTSQ